MTSVSSLLALPRCLLHRHSCALADTSELKRHSFRLAFQLTFNTTSFLSDCFIGRTIGAAISSADCFVGHGERCGQETF